MSASNSPFIRAIAADNSLPIDDEAAKLWIKDLQNPLRWGIRPVLQLLLAVTLHVIWFLKRLPLPQFSAHELLQKTICWFCKYFVSYEANMLILRHFASESNILNFLIANSKEVDCDEVNLYPLKIDDLLESTFVEHDKELFRAFEGSCCASPITGSARETLVSWEGWRNIDEMEFYVERRKTQVLDFETSHALFMCIFCLLLTRTEYRDAINGFNLDQSIAIKVGKIIGDEGLSEIAYNKFPLYLVGPWNLSQRFLMHGFFTEYLYAHLEVQREREISTL